MTSRKLVETSKFLSFVLRYKPVVIGLTLDREGRAQIDLLIQGAAKDGKVLDHSLIAQVAATSVSWNRSALLEIHSSRRAEASLKALCAPT